MRYYCFTSALLQLYCSITAALLLRRTCSLRCSLSSLARLVFYQIQMNIFKKVDGMIRQEQHTWQNMTDGK
jgi:hypothetical protein